MIGLLGKSGTGGSINSRTVIDQDIRMVLASNMRRVSNVPEVCRNMPCEFANHGTERIIFRNEKDMIHGCLSL